MCAASAALHDQRDAAPLCERGAELLARVRVCRSVNAPIERTPCAYLTAQEKKEKKDKDKDSDGEKSKKARALLAPRRERACARRPRPACTQRNFRCFDPGHGVSVAG